MNISTEAGYARHANLLKIAAAIWLLAVSILAVINTVGLSRLDSLRQNAALDARLQALAERVEEVENHFRLFEARPTPAPQSEFIAVRQSLQKKITGIEQTLADTVKADELEAMNNRFEQVQERINALAKPVPVSPVTRTSSSPNRRVPMRSFRILGVELRGGERFLSLFPRAGADSDDLRLLRPGETVGRWRLESLDADTAVFRVNGQTQRVQLPRE